MSNITSYTNQSGNGEKEFNAMLRKKKNILRGWFYSMLLSILGVPIVYLVAPVPFFGAAMIMFLPFLITSVTWLCLITMNRAIPDFFWVTRSEIFVWKKDGCHVMTEKDILTLALRSHKPREYFENLPKSIDMIGSRTSYHRNSNGDLQRSQESTRFILTLKDKTKYYSQTGLKKSKILTEQFANFYSDSSAEAEIKNTVVGRKIARSQK